LASVPTAHALDFLVVATAHNRIGRRWIANCVVSTPIPE
jgi:hypothetical protein